jgi:hypothetical protein
MEYIRQIRFVMAPTFFIGSLLLGAVMDGWINPSRLPDVSGGTAALIVAAAAASILPLGFIFGGVSIVILRLLSKPVLGFKYHEAAMDQATLLTIFTELRVLPHLRTESNAVYADAVYSARKDRSRNSCLGAAQMGCFQRPGKFIRSYFHCDTDWLELRVRLPLGRDQYAVPRYSRSLSGVCMARNSQDEGFLTESVLN